MKSYLAKEFEVSHARIRAILQGKAWKHVQGESNATSKKTAKELNPNALLWVEALESGKFKQTKSVLARKLNDGTFGYCCLGVACQVAVEHGVKISTIVRNRKKVKGEKNVTVKMFAGEALHLPKRVAKWLGLESSNQSGYYINDRQNQTSLVDKNDLLNKNFKQIAKIIRSQPKGLFE